MKPESAETKMRLRKNCRKYYRTHLEDMRKRSRDYQRTHKEEKRAYLETHRDSEKERHRKQWTYLKKLVFDNYGYICVGCGETDFPVLTIDHINGGGNKHRKEVGSLYRWLIKNNFPEGFRVLCRNCQWRSRLGLPLPLLEINTKNNG
jgi:hypothetical protein